MNDLLKLTLDAHGGLDRWRKFHTGSAHLVVGGVLWELKGQAGVLDEVDVRIHLAEQKVSHFPGGTWHTFYTPDRVAIETADGGVLEELPDPRASFRGHTLETQWSRPQLAYFAGYAMWNYFNTPFQFARPGFEVRETELWTENNQTRRRLLVRWPEDVPTHSREQVLYIDAEGLIRRLDYLHDYREVSGIQAATRRIVYIPGEDHLPLPDGPVVVSIGLSNIQLQ